MAKAVVHFEIAGPDAKALEKFYGELFGWTTNSDNPMNYTLVFPMKDGIGGGLPQTMDGSSYVSFYVSTDDDVPGVLKKAVDLGATVVIDAAPPNPPAPALAMFADPDGNFIGLIGGDGTEEPPMYGSGAPVNWFEVAGKDGAKSQQFYKDLFGWEINADNPMQYGETPHLARGIGGGIFGSDEPAVRVYAEVPDLDASLKKAGELGGKTVAEPMDVPGGPTIAMFADPAGNTIGLIKSGSFGG